MSRSKGTTKKPLAPYESTIKIQCGNRQIADTYARITESLLSSEAFINLSPQIQILYIFMRAQEMGKRKPNRDYDEESLLWEAVRSEQCIYFPRTTAAKYAPKYKNNSGRLCADIDVLIEHGFIDKVVSGKQNREKNVYKFSDRWQEWRKPP